MVLKVALTGQPAEFIAADIEGRAGQTVSSAPVLKFLAGWMATQKNNAVVAQALMQVVTASDQFSRDTGHTSGFAVAATAF
jgi:hypothetical protein